MSILADVSGWFKKLGAVINGIHAVWSAIEDPRLKAIALGLIKDGMTAVAASESAAQAGGINLTLDLDVVADIKAVIADVKAGKPTVVAEVTAIVGDLKTLGL